MTSTIAVVGKGGTGKTTFAALTIKYLLSKGRRPVLAIDADPSANLNMALGLKLHQTVGTIREDACEQISEGTFQQGIPKPDWFWYQVMQCVVEGEGIDLLAMGRPEGPGCYCAANHMLRQSVDSLGDDYPVVVIDNEAGMEHISRQTTRDVDWLFIISDPTQRGLEAAERIVELVESLKTRVGRTGLVLNRVRGEMADALYRRASGMGVPFLGALPEDAAVGAFDIEGRPLIELDESSAIYPAVVDLLSATLG